MDNQQQNKNNPENNDSSLPSIIFYGGFIALYVFTKLIAGDDQKLGNEIFAPGFVIWLFSTFIAFMKGKNFEETKENYIALAQMIKFFIIIIVVIVILSPLLPSSCTELDNTPAPSDIYFRR